MSMGHDAVPPSVWAGWLLANVVGGAVIALPDSGPRLFSLSRTHGPSAVDALGAVIVLSGWIVLDLAIVRRFSRLLRLPWGARAALLVAAGAGALVLVPAIGLDLGAWWVLGVVLLAVAQLASAVAVSVAGWRGRTPSRKGAR